MKVVANLVSVHAKHVNNIVFEKFMHVRVGGHAFQKENDVGH
jgi:hypothetical protein